MNFLRKMQNYADSFCQSAFFATHEEYHYPMIKVEWLAAGVLLILSSGVGMVLTGQICRC
jgi:hypothetical protein